MRVISLFAALSFALVLSCAASTQTGKTSSLRSDRHNTELGIIHPLYASVVPGNLADDRGFDSEREKECYTLRTYRMKRERPDSDVTERDGYSTCQRASKFGVKKAERAGETSSREPQ
jgi:hypothetical protein